QIGACGDELRRIIERDATDGGEWHAKRKCKQAERCAHGGGLGGRSEHAAERDVVGAFLDRRARERCIVVARDTEELAVQALARRRELAVVAAKMCASG